MLQRAVTDVAVFGGDGCCSACGDWCYTTYIEDSQEREDLWQRLSGRFLGQA